MHVSIPLDNTCELLNFTPVNPLISRCQIKVCYVGDEPNRNRSVITKAVATEMAKSLPGCPIVGFFDKETNDFDEHTRQVEFNGGKIKVIDMTKAYGFVDLAAKVWFQKFNDEGVEHEYLMTEGYIWSDIYPEAKRILEKGNNQSMELSQKLTHGHWTKDDNGTPRFFIINDTVIQKLCILGENVEPCFEGAGIAAQFSLDDNFKETVYAMLKDIQAALEEGGLTHMTDEMNTAIVEEPAVEETVEIVETVTETPVEENFKKNEGNSDSDTKNNSDEDKEEKKCPECGKPMSECTCDEKPKNEHSLTDHPEYVELLDKYNALSEQYVALESEISSLREFKANVDREKKQQMIDSFYMLSAEDKKEVSENIDKYSLDDIEAKLSIICVRNKVSFALEDESNEEETDPVVYSLSEDNGNDGAPAWIKAVRDTAKSMK